MAKYKLTIEVTADSISELWEKLSDAEMADSKNYSEDERYWSWCQNGWEVEVEKVEE